MKCLVYFLISLVAWAICSVIIRWGYAIPMREPSALVCLQQSFPAVDCCLGAVLFRSHAKSHCGNLYLSGVHLALSGAEWLHLAHGVACVLSENRAGLSADAFCHRLSQCGIDGLWLFRSKKELLLLGGIIVVCLTLSCVIWQLRLNRIEKKKQGTVTEKEEPVSLQA